jgi:hypothetical protein
VNVNNVCHSCQYRVLLIPDKSFLLFESFLGVFVCKQAAFVIQCSSALDPIKINLEGIGSEILW